MDDFMTDITVEEMYDDEMAEFMREMNRKTSRTKKVSKDDFDAIRDPEYDYDDFAASYPYERDYED